MKDYSGNQSFLKDLNLITSLHQIRSHGLISRAELANILGLNRSTITAIINELINRKLVREVGIGAQMRGRPPTLLQFNNEAGYTVCVDCGSQAIKIYITDLGDKIFFEKTLDPMDGSALSQIKQMIHEIKSALQDLPPKDLGLLGIGIAVTGIIKSDIVTSFNLEWYDIPLHSYFQEEFDCPIVIDNDANAGLIAESYFGSAIGERNVCYIRIGRGLSAGLLMDGRIYKGNEGFAGRVGHVSLDINGRKCICGNRGCWEMYVSEKTLIQRYLELTGKTESSERVSTDLIMQRVKEADIHAISAVHEMAEYMGIGISNIFNFLNPGMVVIGNSMNQIDNILYNPLNLVIQQRVLPVLRKTARFTFSTLGEKAIVLGTTALVLDHVFSTPIVRVNG